MSRLTKIVATLGPATTSADKIEQLIRAGTNVVRLNFSHGEYAEHKARADLVRQIARDLNVHVAVLGDLQGPKIRIARFKEGEITLTPGQDFVLDSELDKDAGNQTQVGLDYPHLANDCAPGDVLLLDDGRLQLEIIKITGSKIETTVTVGGKLSNHKGINRQGGGLSAPALTQKDLSDIERAAQIDVDYLAISFPKHAEDIHKARQLLEVAGSQAGIVAKIERAEAVNDPKVLDDIILASDAVMVARGDLGVEIGDAELIGVQKYLINRARTLNRVIITATQMMESMIQNPLPTRAEVFDVANAVLDGTDAVMLSAETAAGEHPIQVIEAMSRVCVGAEKYAEMQPIERRQQSTIERVDEAIARATIETANRLQGVKAIVCLSESGSTTLWMSRIRSNLPIYVLTRHAKTRTKVTLYRGVVAIPFDVTGIPRDNVNKIAIETLTDRELLQDGDRVLLTKGDHMGIPGGTNAIKILTVGKIA